MLRPSSKAAPNAASSQSASMSVNRNVTVPVGGVPNFAPRSLSFSRKSTIAAEATPNPVSPK
jgi:hypothetical protein